MLRLYILDISLLLLIWSFIFHSRKVMKNLQMKEKILKLVVKELRDFRVKVLN